MLESLFEQMRGRRGDLALATPHGTATYETLADRAAAWGRVLAPLPPGSILAIEGDYGLETIAAFLASTAAGHVAVPLSPDSRGQHASFLQIASVEYRIRPLEGEAIETTGVRADHPLYSQLRAEGHPGLVLFTSGSTGQPKAALHDLARLLAKYEVPRKRYRTLVFLLLDHIGGVNTLFYTIYNGGAVVLAADRSPAAVCEAIETHGVELLPTSPTFLNLLLLSGELTRRALSSLAVVTYGTEPMPAATLEVAARALPHVRFQQTYGLTELGILRSQSRDSQSLWVRVGGEDFSWKVVDGRLWILAKAAMLGYLNAPSPFDADGYFDTGDLVEVDGEWLRFLGRKSDIINVGGNKVFPAEVESVLLQMENVEDAVVRGERHPLTGHIVTATIRLASPETPDAFKLRMRQFCAERLASFQVPSRVRFTDAAMHNARFKRLRQGDGAPPDQA